MYPLALTHTSIVSYVTYVNNDALDNRKAFIIKVWNLGYSFTSSLPGTIFTSKIHYWVFQTFLLIIPFIYISNDIPLPGYPSTNPTSHIPHPTSPSSPLPLWGCASNPLLPHHFSIPLHRGIKPPQEQGPPSHWCQTRFFLMSILHMPLKD